jgi:periplasmic divalent cation tolerance protein
MTKIKSFELLIVTTSFGTLEEARLMAQKLLAARLAACVQIHDPIYSLYRWEGEIREESEVLLSAKTDADKWDKISTFIKTHHPYELPELTGMTATEYDIAYGEWVRAETN